MPSLCFLHSPQKAFNSFCFGQRSINNQCSSSPVLICVMIGLLLHSILLLVRNQSKSSMKSKRMVSNCTSLPNGLKRGKGIITNLLCKAKKSLRTKTRERRTNGTGKGSGKGGGSDKIRREDLVSLSWGVRQTHKSLAGKKEYPCFSVTSTSAGDS